MEFNGFLKVVVDRQGITDTKIDHEGPLNAVDIRIIAGDLTPVFHGFQSEPEDTRYIVTGEATSDDGSTLSINLNATKGAMLAFSGNVQAGTSDQSHQNIGAQQTPIMEEPKQEEIVETETIAEETKQEEIVAEETKDENIETAVTEIAEEKIGDENQQEQPE